jgi:hypothetical protein
VSLKKAEEEILQLKERLMKKKEENTGVIDRSLNRISF